MIALVPREAVLCEIPPKTGGIGWRVERHACQLTIL